MSELEKMGNILMETALNFTHPMFKDMYPEWGTVCNIGEELVRMSKQPELSENQQVVFDYLASENRLTKEAPLLSINNFSQDHFGGKLPEKVGEAYRKLNAKEDYEILAAFAEWGMKNDQ